MLEQQNTEYKSVWKDEYLKWVCGFANARSGKIYIGKDDNPQSLQNGNFSTTPSSAGEAL
jgi:predicted HTH transcriptional regulator